RVKNQGTVPVTNLRVTALVPKEMVLVRARGPADNRLGKETREGQELVYEPLKNLAPGASVTYEIRVRAKQAGGGWFKADVTADQLKAGGPVHEEESTYVFAEVGPVQSRARQALRFWWTRRGGK